MPGFPRLREAYDIVVVGGGHAGLHAGLKASLLHHTAAVVDRGPKYSRSYYAPKMVNIPGFPDGVSGHRLLDLQIAALRAEEERVGYFTPAVVSRVEPVNGGFDVHFDWLKQSKVTRGRAVILAMGVVDRMPVVGGKIDPVFPWANFALVDFCVFCDGHDMTDRTVAVLGHDAFAALTALDLVHWRPKSVELLPNGEPFLGEETAERRAELESRLAAAGISHFDAAITGFEGIQQKVFSVRFSDGSLRTYDRGFSGLGWYDMHAQIPRSLGARFDAEGYVATDEDCRVLSEATGEAIPGLYCIGDLRSGWNQIPEAWATAERAAIHAYAYYL